MSFRLRFTPQAKADLAALRAAKKGKALYEQVLKTLGLIETNLRHPSLNTHKFVSLRGPSGEEVFVAYAQNNTPGAYRVFFCYGPDETEEKKRVAVITIIAITPHP